MVKYRIGWNPKKSLCSRFVFVPYIKQEEFRHMKSMKSMKKMIRMFAFAAAVCVLFPDAPADAWRGVLGWTYNAQYPISSSVAVAGELVLAGDSVGNLHAVYAASGRPAWVYKGTYSVVGRPAAADGRVVFAQADGTITALSLANGSLLWKHSPSEDALANTVVDGAAIGDGKVFFVRGDGKMIALSAESGKVLWAYDSGQELRSAPVFSDGTVFLGEQKGVFSAVNPANGRRAWGGGAGGPINTPTAEGGDVYFSSWDGSVHRVRIKGVVPQWKAGAGDPVTTPPLVGKDKVFVGTANGRVAAFSKADGSARWSFDTQGGTVSGMPAAAEGLLFVGGGQGTLFVLDAETGVSRFVFQTGGGINGAPAFADGVLFLGSADGNVYAIL
jgi:outer membrane protein assembly factor BamB